MTVKRRESRDNAFNKAKTNLKPANAREIEEIKTEESTSVPSAETEEVNKETEQVENTSKNSSTKKEEKNKKNRNDDIIDPFMAASGKKRGEAKNIYLSSENVKYINDICEKYDIKFGPAVNIIIKEYIDLKSKSNNK